MQKILAIVASCVLLWWQLGDAKSAQSKNKHLEFALECLGFTLVSIENGRTALVAITDEIYLKKSELYKALPPQIRKLVDQAEAALSAERYEEALAFYQQAISAKPDDAFLRSAMAATYQLLGKHAEAIAQYEEVLKLRSDDVDAVVAIGDIYALSLADNMSALYWYSKAMKGTSDPNKKKLIADRIKRFLAK